MKRMAPKRSRAAGFTLLEILTVMIIIAILFAFVMRGVMSGEDIVRAENTRGFLSQVEAAISEYHLEHGDYPPSTFPASVENVPNKVNMGAESLVLKLFSKEWTAREISEDRLGNSDEDALRQSATSFSNPDLFELADDWGNPIVYIHRRDYEKPQSYVTIDPETGEPYETEVKAYLNPKTGDPYNRRKYQLISAGPDGV